MLAGRKVRVSILSACLVLMLFGGISIAGIIKCFKGHENGSVAGFETIDLEMFRAQPLSSRLYTEVWFHEMQFPDEGIIVIVNFQLNNLGWSRGYCDTYITYSDSDTGLIADIGRTDPEDVKMDKTGFGMTVGEHRIELDGDKYRIRYSGKDIQADFTYDILAPSFQQGDGIIAFEGTDDFVKYNFPIPWARVKGTLKMAGKTKELEGWGSMNHDWQVLSPVRFMSDWRAFWLYDKELTVGIVMCTSEDLQGKWVQRLVVAEKGRILFSSHDYKVEERDFRPVSISSVKCPYSYSIEACHGDDWLKGEVKVVRVQEKKNILEGYPSLFRKLAEFLADETWSYRFWADFSFDFHHDGETRHMEGRGTGNFVDSVKHE